MGIKSRIRLFVFSQTWRKSNKHNQTNPTRVFNSELVTVGNNTYGNIDVLAFNNKNHLSIGNYVSIGPGTCFVLSADHATNTLSTFPFKTKLINGELEGKSKGDIIVDDDVWMGNGVTILSGVHIGQGAVIAAGAVVNKNVEPYAIVGGIPAKTIRYRFSERIRNKLLSFDFGLLSKEMIIKHLDELYMDVEKMDEQEINQIYDWFPKRDISN